MTYLSRRGFVGGVAAAAAAQTPTEIDRGIVTRHDEAVDRLLRSQVTDSASRWVGGVPDSTGLHGAGAAGGLLTACATSMLQRESRFHQAPLMMERIRLAAAFLTRSQTPDGNFDLLSTNFNSPPDTGFIVHGLGSAASLAKRASRAELLAVLEPILRKAGGAMAVGGVHTPNHRWVVCSALAQIHEVFPDSVYVRRIEQWLAEEIDIDEDGRYTERSTGVYNPICDRALVVMAAKLKKPELLDPVRRNLDAMLYLLHPGYEVVTEISRRQDQYGRADMGGYWFPLQFLAVYDGNGRYAALASHFASRAASLTALIEYPELLRQAPTPAGSDNAMPDNYEKLFPALQVARIRRGAVSVTILLDGDSHFLSFRRGEAAIASLRFASAFFGKGQFVPSGFGKAGGTYQLKQSLEAGYYQPLDPPRRVKAGEWGAVRRERKVSEICRLQQSASISETRTGIKVRLRAFGTIGVPLAVEIALREGGQLEGCEETPHGHILAAGFATYKVGADSLRFGPGKREHAYTQVRGAAAPAPGTRVYLCGFTPFDHELEIG